MTEGSTVREEESMAGTATSTATTTTTTTTAETKQRRRRKWDQPAESLISAGLAIPGVLPLGNMGNLVGISLPAVAPLSGAPLTNSIPVSGVSVPQIFQAPTIQQNAASIVQKLNQPKIQDELIAREIVINDAEPTIRYKLTKRQTQEEIQKCSGAVVITRGKYRPPNGIPDSEKPLYLHISAGAHLKETAERIKAVDRAAAMVEEILRQGQNLKAASTAIGVTTGGQANQLLSTSLYLGFDPDPSLNITARIRGPNDQYINHIMNETGATVTLRGQGSGNLETTHGEEVLQPLHLYLTSKSSKTLEDAKHLAENLLDTISVECGASRVSSCRVYGAVPPPQQLLAGVSNSGMEQKVNVNPVAGSTCSSIGSTSAAPSLMVTQAPVSSVTPPQRPVSQSGAIFHYGQSQSNVISYPQPSVTGGTSYSGYGGIYPQATPLQQVALALRQVPAQAASVLAATAPAVGTSPKITNSSSCETEKRPPQKRKFQELPVASKGTVTTHQNSHQGSEFLKPGVLAEDLGLKNVSTMPPPKKLVQSTSNGMLPPPSRMMPSPPPKFPSPPPSQKAVLPPPPKFPVSPPSQKEDSKNYIAKKPTADPVPDTLMKLVEYGEEDDDIEGDGEESPKTEPRLTTGKPFWAL